MSVPKQIGMLCVTEVPFSSFLRENIPVYKAGISPQMYAFVDDSEVLVLL
jgi:hypothetical protein